MCRFCPFLWKLESDFPSHSPAPASTSVFLSHVKKNLRGGNANTDTRMAGSCHSYRGETREWERPLTLELCCVYSGARGRASNGPQLQLSHRSRHLCSFQPSVFSSNITPVMCRSGCSTALLPDGLVCVVACNSPQLQLAGKRERGRSCAGRPSPLPETE